MLACRAAWLALSLPLPLSSSRQVSLQVAQSVVLGYLTDYFTIINPTPEDTRDAYLLAAGECPPLCH